MFVMKNAQDNHLLYAVIKSKTLQSILYRSSDIVPKLKPKSILNWFLYTEVQNV